MSISSVDLNQQLFARGGMGGGASGKPGAVLGIFRDVECMKGLSLQGISFLDKPICQSSVIGAVAFNAPNSKNPETWVKKLGANVHQACKDAASGCQAIYAGPVLPGATFSAAASGAPAASGAGAELV